jgi:cell division protease FtsH
MVCEWGMSKLGPISLSQEDEPIFIGKEIARHKDYSEKTAQRIDEEVNAILEACLSKARKILSEHRGQLESLTNELVLKETLNDAEVRVLLGFPPLAARAGGTPGPVTEN